MTVSQEAQIIFQEVEPMSGQQGIDYSALNLVYREDKGISKITKYSPGYMATNTIPVRNENYVEDTEQTQNDKMKNNLIAMNRIST